MLARLVDLDPKQLERGHVASPALRALKMLVSQRVSMVRQLVGLKNQLIGYANALWPGVSRVFGDLDSAREIARNLEAEYGTGFEILRDRARIYALLGETDTAASLLAQAFEEGSGAKYPWIPFPWGEFLYDFESLRGHRTFEALMRPKK